MERNNYSDEYLLRLVQTATLASGGVPADTSVFNDPTVLANLFDPTNTDAYKISGATATHFALPLLNHPAMEFGQNIIDQRKAIGVSYRHTGTGYEFQQGTRYPTTTWEVDVTKNNIVPILWLFFQKGASEAASTPYLKTFVPYGEGQSDTEVCAALCRKMSSGDADSHVFGGCVVSSITFSADQGMPLKASITFVGYNGLTDYDFNSVANVADYDPTAPLLWQNASATLASTPINMDGFSLTLNNNVIPKFYNQKHPYKFVLGDFTATGSFQLPWATTTVGGNVELNKFINGTDSLLKIYWGTGSHTTDGDVEFEINCRYDNMTTEGDSETVQSVSFLAAHDGTNGATRVYVADAIDRGIS